MIDAERTRVEIAYAKRARLEERYDARRPDVVATRAAAARAFGAALRHHASRLPASVLEVGCGFGSPVSEVPADPDALRIGVDVQRARVAAAAAAYPRLRLAVADGRYLPLRDGSIEVVLCSTLFSSVLDPGVASAIAGDIDRVLVPGGVVLWFDLRVGNPRNPDVRAVRRRDLRRLFPGYDVRVRPCVLAPPVARRLAAHPVLAALLEQVRPLRSHLGGGLHKPAGEHRCAS